MQARVGWTIGIVLMTAAQIRAEDWIPNALETLRRPPVTGLFVFEIVPGSTAEKAGIRIGDILTHYDGQAVATHLDLTRLARIVNEEMRDEVLVILHRQGDEIDLTVPPGPVGVRLEDVVAGEERILPPASSPTPARSDHSWLDRLLASSGERWMLIFAEGQPRPVGWARHTFAKPSEFEGSLRIEQYLAQSQAVVRQDIGIRFSLDPCLSVRQMRLSANDKLVLDVRAERDKLVGTRAGVPVESPLFPQTVSGYLAPYVAMGRIGSGPPSVNCRYLPPGSLESAPYSEIAVSRAASLSTGIQPETAFVVRKLGREEMSGSIDDRGRLLTLHLRGGLRMEPASEEDIRRAFPK